MSSKTNHIIIDAGMEHLHLAMFLNGTNKNLVIPNIDKIENLFKRYDVLKLIARPETQLYLTGKLAEIVRDTLRRGQIVLPGAALWSATDFLLKTHQPLASLGIIDLSASGYMVVAISSDGKLINDLLITNPRCGAGSGINLSRILEKLAIARGAVDVILKNYLGETGKAKRQAVGIRADRCGVFSSSATISDKNQGLPLDFALAVTMKSEVLKACKKMSAGVDAVFLTGRVFNWQFCRDCARDYLLGLGVKNISFDRQQNLLIRGVEHLIQTVGPNNFKKQTREKLSRPEKFLTYPSFKNLKEKYTAAGLYKRLPDPVIREIDPADLGTRTVNLGLDVGSTMAKMLVADAATDEILFKSSCDNHGDTIETIKHIFSGLISAGIPKLSIARLGITGSGRYQVQKVLQKIYPALQDKIFVLVENYAHAHGSIAYAKEQIQNLKNQSREVNEDFCLLVDIGGEDTKVSVISLKKEELFDNAMNIKCSAGTGSLMDTLKSLFGIKEIGEACRQAFDAPKAYEINATCAVFLMENARKMQALGYPKNEILASTNYAIVENMARTLWNQIKLPDNAVVLLHGQTMLSDPLPLAVTRRLQESGTRYALVPPLPGHRACLGLVKSIRPPLHQPADHRADKTGPNICRLADFINLKFKKQIVVCQGAACGDKNARCSRALLSALDLKNKLVLTLGGCTAVNELGTGLQAGRVRTGRDLSVQIDAYKDIWQFIDAHLPKSAAKNRLVIPRSFAISEQAFFLAKIFEKLGLPVDVDNVREEDILQAQGLFNIEVCAPLIGATGQFIRLAGSAHGLILTPQIDFLPTAGIGLGRTCTTNQGGVIIAERQAKLKYPAANFFSFVLSLKKTDPAYLAKQLHEKAKGVFAYYGLTVTAEKIRAAVEYADAENQNLRERLALKVASYLEEAIRLKRPITVVCGREYILNPGIYDSHVGKLLKDKGMVALPAYALESRLDPDFAYIYWKNPHDLLTKINAITNKELHLYLKHPRLKQLIGSIEAGLPADLSAKASASAKAFMPAVALAEAGAKAGQTDCSISTVRVSTFRCGPDTVTAPILSEITKKTPSLLIQSDAMIKELAHLENRVNTFLNQLNQKLHEEFSSKRFEIKLVDEFGQAKLNQDTDVIYFPTLHDNRTITAVFKAAGFTVIDNYNDQTYDLEHKVRLGRIYAGDSVCAPLAAVFADIILSMEDFLKRQRAADPQLSGKTRILVFDNKGTGPCRQGQYYEMHKLLLCQQFGRPADLSAEASAKVEASAQAGLPAGEAGCSGRGDGDKSLRQQIKLLVGHEREGFNVGLPEWAMIQAFQGVILQGVLHSLLLTAGAACRDYDQYQEFYKDYLELKNDVYKILETRSRPSRVSLYLAEKIGKRSLAAGAIYKYFSYGLHNNNGLRKILRKFSSRWVNTDAKFGAEVGGPEAEKPSFAKASENRPNFAKVAEDKQNKINIHIEGEAYMRVAQVEMIFRSLIDALGFGSFKATYSPLWCYLELLLEFAVLECREEIGLSPEQRTAAGRSVGQASSRRKKQRLITKIKLAIKILRWVLAGPLYRAAGVQMPDPMKRVLESAQAILPSLKPHGELPPYLGEAILKIKHGTDLFLNVAPEGCMVSSMAQLFSSPILKSSGRPARIQDLFTLNGEVNEEQLKMSLLKVLGPEKYYRK